jgi:acyl-CoA thioester hydrolase
MNDTLLQEYPVVIEIPVAWGEMDSYQHVNNVVYFRYFESARIAYAEKLGLFRYKEETGIGPILGSTSCRYRLPLTYPDTVSVGARTISMEEDRFTMHYVVVSSRHGKVAAEGDAVIVMYDYNQGRKTKVPDVLRQRMTEIEKETK